MFQLSIFHFEISESFFFAILWQRNARRPRDSGPCRSEARLQSWDLVWALPLPLQALHKSALLLYTLQKSAPAGLQNSASAPAGHAKVCPCLCRPCKSLPLHSCPTKFWALPLHALQKSAPASAKQNSRLCLCRPGKSLPLHLGPAKF